MIKESVKSFFGQIGMDLLDILKPAIIILFIIIILYTFLQIVKMKFFEDKEGKELFIGSFSETFIFLIDKMPAILIFLAIITGFSLLINVGDSFYKIYNNQQRIKELTVFVKNLSRNDKIAQVLVCEKGVDFQGDYGIYKVDIYDGITGDVISENEYRVQGRDFRLDAMVINFDYSEIGAGTQRNLAFPYRIFSDKIAPENSIILESIFTESYSDQVIENEIEGMLGLSRETFRQRAKEFIKIVNDPVQSQELGIRSSYGNTITIPANSKINDEYAIYIEGSGGLSFKNISVSNNDFENISYEETESVEEINKTEITDISENIQDDTKKSDKSIKEKIKSFF